MAAIRERLKRFSLEHGADTTIKDVRIGLGYTAVTLENGRCGVAYTFHEDLKEGCRILQRLRPLEGKKVSRILELFDSSDKVESAIALAASNALTNMTNRDQSPGDILEYLQLFEGERVCMIGYFAPIIPELQKRGVELKVYEKSRRFDEALLSQGDVLSELPHCDVALISATSILNHTLDDLLGAAGRCREVVLLGASTPLTPQVFSETPVTILSGVVVTDPREISRIVSEAGGMRLFKRYVKKVNLRIQEAKH